MCVFDPIELQPAGFEITGGIVKGCHNLRAECIANTAIG